MNKFIWTYVLFWFIVIYIKDTNAVNGEYKLLRDLFMNYNNEARPVSNDSDSIVVKIGMALNQIVDIKEKSESIAISVFLRQIWNDAQLKWKPADYNNVTSFNVNPKKIWKPDIVLYNNVDEDKTFGGSMDQLQNRIIIQYTGEVKWLTPVLLSAKCPMNVEYFPFDTQKCDMKFGSWSYNGFQLDLQALSPDVDLGTYTNHTEWYLESGTLKRNVLIYSCCPEPFPDVTIQFVLKRRSLFYLLNLIFPMVVISMLTMLSFYLPAESGERIALAITLLLAMTVFMLIVGDIIPPTSETVPLVAAFFSAVMIEMVLMIILLCYILNLHFKTKNDSPMPMWMRKIVLDRLSYMLGIRKKAKSQKEQAAMDKKLKQLIELGAKNSNINGNGTTVTYVQNGIIHKDSDTTNNTFQNAFTTSNIKPRPIPNEDKFSRVLTRKLDVFLQRFIDEAEENLIQVEWRICAMTFDRMSLIFFGLVFTVTALGVFLRAPQFIA